jgi:hypothetical protein
VPARGLARRLLRGQALRAHRRQLHHLGAVAGAAAGAHSHPRGAQRATRRTSRLSRRMAASTSSGSFRPVRHRHTPSVFRLKSSWSRPFRVHHKPFFCRMRIGEIA